MSLAGIFGGKFPGMVGGKLVCMFGVGVIEAYLKREPMESTVGDSAKVR